MILNANLSGAGSLPMAEQEKSINIIGSGIYTISPDDSKSLVKVEAVVQVKSNFKSIIDKTVTEINNSTWNTIGKYAFYKCLALTSVTLNNVTTIENSAFDICENLTDLYLPNNQMCVLEGYLGGRANPTIHVPANLLNSYKTATNWSRYADKFEAI